MLTASIQFNIPALPDNDIWFANSQAWSNYWNGIAATATLSPAATALYVPVPYNNALVYCRIDIDGQDYNLVTDAMLTSLLGQLNALDAAVQDLRTQMKTAGYITNAQ
jgi:hypothetical protein